MGVLLKTNNNYSTVVEIPVQVSATTPTPEPTPTTGGISPWLILGALGLLALSGTGGKKK